MKFLTGLTLNLEKLPKYTAFSGDFVLDIDMKSKLILKQCCESDDPVFNKEIKERISNIMNHIKTDTLTVTHKQRLGIGRFYPDESVALITLSRHAKHTLFKYMDWVDLDMIKGHCTILFNIFKGIYELTAFKRYIEHTDEVFNELLEFYDVDNTLNKDDIKNVFNISIYGGSYNTWLKEIDKKNKELKTDEIHPFILSFIDECKEISNLIFKANPQLKNKITQRYCDDKEEWKIKNSVMSYFCQAIENEILHIAYKFFVKQNIITPRKNVELEYDGLCFKMPHDITLEELDTKVNELNDKVLKETGFNVKFKLKPYDNRHIHYDIIENTNNHIEDMEDDMDSITEPLDFIDVVSKKDGYSFDEVAATFEKNHAKILNKSCFIKTTENDNIIMSRQMIKTSCEHLVYNYEDKDGKTRTKNFINDWLTNNPKQRCYDDIAVYPNDKLCPPTHFNMWRKFPMELVEKYEPKNEELAFILNHIKVLCNHDLVVYNYLINWIAQMIQFPEVKTTCPTFISQEGAGKGSLIRLFEKMLGDCKVFETTKPSRDVWGDFNGRMANTFLIILNELSKKETLEAEGYIKGLITDPKLTINNKGYNQFDITSYHRFIVCTNKEEPCNTNKDDRRKWFVRCSDELIGNKDYFNKYYEYMNDTNVIKTVFEYFKNIPDTENFNKLPIPVTEYHQSLIEYSQSPIERWLEDFTYKNQNRDIIELKMESILEKFNEWCSENGVEYKVDSLKLAVRMGRLKIDGIEKNRTNKDRITTFDITKMKSHFKIGCLL